MQAMEWYDVFESVFVNKVLSLKPTFKAHSNQVWNLHSNLHLLCSVNSLNLPKTQSQIKRI